MTSNIGSQLILEYQGQVRGDQYERIKESVLDALRHHFRPEFLNRVDEIIVFHSLSEADLKKIVDIQLDRLRGRLAERRITLDLTDEAKTHLALAGYDPVYGARPLKRAIQREIETPLSKLILKGDVKENAVVRAQLSGGEITFSIGPLAAEAEGMH